MTMRKIWCLHCETVTAFKGKKQTSIPNNMICSECGADWTDVCDCTTGIFKQAYPDIKYEDIVINKHYPLYPE